MENNIKYDRDDTGKGPVNYLNFWLQTTKVPLSENGGRQQTDLGYFSLRQALGDLLFVNLELIDPQLATSSGATHYQMLLLTDQLTDTNYGTLIYERPGHCQFAVAEPGIYLQSDFSCEMLSKLTGFPFPDAASLDDERLIQLASYNKDFSAIEPNMTYSMLINEIENMRRDMETVRQGMRYATIIKGVLGDTGPSGQLPQPPAYFVEHHYFASELQSVAKLLDVDLTSFNYAFGIQAATDQHIRHAYTVDPHSGNSSFMVQTIAISSDRTDIGAGVHLTYVKDGARLGAPDNPGITLGIYDGSHLVPDVASKINRRELLLDLLSEPNREQTTSDYLLTISYKLQQKQPCTGPRFEKGDEIYHHDNLGQAIGGLLVADLQLLAPHNAGRGLYNVITAARVQDSDGEDICRLEKGEVQHFFKADVIYLTIVGGLQRLKDNHGIGLDITALANDGLGYKLGRSNGDVMIPLAIIGRDGHLEVLSDNVNELLDQLDRHNPAINATIKDKPGERQQQAVVELRWQTSDYSPKEVMNVPFSDIDSAYLFLVTIDKSMFSPIYGVAHSPYISTANLRMAQDQNVLVSRFFMEQDAGGLCAGHYLRYDEQSVEAVRLASRYANSSMSEDRLQLQLRDFQHIVKYSHKSIRQIQAPIDGPQQRKL